MENCNPPILSICYATKNRSDLLNSSIRSLIKHCSQCQDIELIVIDSSSNFHSVSNRTFLKSITGSFKHTFYKNTIPEGTDVAYHLAVSSANSTYVWLLSDDDLICASVDSCIENIRRLVAINSNACLLINMALASSNLDSIYLDSLLDVTLYLESSSSTLIKILESSGSLSSHISFVIFSRFIWLDVFEFFPRIPHLTIAGVNLYLASAHDCILVSSPLLLLRSGCQSWSSDSFSIWYIYWPSLLLYLGLKPSYVLSSPFYRLTAFIRNLVFYRAISSDISNPPILTGRLSPIHNFVYASIQKLPKSISFRLSIFFSALSRFPEITLLQLLNCR
jgi:glycosyltransferase involved in cell wall biosynthesis